MNLKNRSSSGGVVCAVKYLFSLIFTLALCVWSENSAAQVAGRDSLALRGGDIDTTLKSTPKPLAGPWRRPQVRHEATSAQISREAYRYFGSPITFTSLMEESGLAYPLMLDDNGIGRESFLSTSRYSEPLLNTRANRALPLNDPLTGASMLNYFSMDAFQAFTLDQGARGLFHSGSDNAGSDLVDLSIERFRAPLPFSRIHYTQVLATGLSNFDGVFSVNTSEAANFMVGVFRRGVGGTRAGVRPEIDLWSGRAQFTYEHWLTPEIKDTSSTKLVLPREKSFDLLLWFNYINSFANTSGGINPASDSDDVFNDQLAQVTYPNGFEHRIRLDGLAQMEFFFLGDEPTRLSLYATHSGRVMEGLDSASPIDTLDEADYGSRYGVALEQPFTLRLGSFVTRAAILGEVQLLDKDTVNFLSQTVTDTRLMAGASDSLALEGALGLNLYGVAKLVQSNVKVGEAQVESRVFPSIGLTGAVDIADWVKFTASYSYAKDWAVMSPSPTTEYQIRNIGGYFDARLRLSRRDSVALHVGILDRNEPEGIIYDFIGDTLLLPTFSNKNVHSQSALVKLDAYFSYFRWSSALTYYPGVVPASRFTSNAAAAVDPKLRFSGWTGLFYENEIAEGNLRMSAGARMRYLNRLAPTLSYDPFSDYYLYQGLKVGRDGSALNDIRIEQPKYIFDIVISTEVDRRAQVNMSFLNILSAPFYNVELYPRPGFQWRVDVTWAFLD
ncbi:MAG TPA: hypothetical protein VFH43_03580 [Candidatus Kapabacteria bacterium]|nr:hypothetical protein [Candidatus Kapabacteria bacterium]